nr:molybdopterin-binding protein [Thaumasiovibrio subtropicus]
MLSTGEEVLHGDIVDSNAAWFSQRCFDAGVGVCRRVTVGDELQALSEEMLSLSRKSDVVIVNGGLGPTEDDLSAAAAAMAANVGLVLSEAWLEEMREKYRRLQREMPETNLKQAMLPDGARVIDNPVGTACGFHLKLNQADFYFTPGVPSEFFRMVDDLILPEVLAHPAAANRVVRGCHRFYTFGLSESGISERLRDVNLPDQVDIGYRSYLPFIEVKIFADLESPQFPALRDEVASRLGDNVLSVNQPLIAAIGERLDHYGLSVSVAEQFTAGQVTAQLHDNEVTSQYVIQSWFLKPKLDESLADADPLAAALAMATASREKTGADIGLSTGANVDGYVAVALATVQGEFGILVRQRRKRNLSDQRLVVATLVLDILRRYLNDLPLCGEYESLSVEGEVLLPREGSQTSDADSTQD